MRFLVNKSDFDIELITNSSGRAIQNKVTSATSVNILKSEFYHQLVEIGSLIQIDETTQKEYVEKLCNESDVIYACVHDEPMYDVSCRLLRHSLGGLMLPGGFLNKWTPCQSTLNIVTSHIQKKQLEQSLGESCFNLGVCTPTISNQIFYLNPLESNQKNSFTITYAGRIIANKGLIQTIRALNIWPIENTELKIIGDYEPDFFIYQSNAYNTTFSSYFVREGINKSPNLKINMKGFVGREDLKDHYWQSDCFIYPSFHEDENFGLAPREAILSGIPAVVSDFCGLSNLRNTSGFAIKTYPSLAGIRYSLKELAQSISSIRNRPIEAVKSFAASDAEFIKNEVDKEMANKDLKSAVKMVSEMPINPPLSGGWRSEERLTRWVTSDNSQFTVAVALKDTPLTEGLYTDGTGDLPGDSCFSEPHFMKAIQSIYTTIPQPPLVQKNNTYRGFWRVSLWDQEQAIIEFGFPGPRKLNCDNIEFEALKNCYEQLADGDGFFVPKTQEQIVILQKLLELGYIVPDEF